MAQLATKPDHVVPDKPGSFWKYPPAQKGHALPCAVHAAFRWVHPQPQAAQEVCYLIPRFGEPFSAFAEQQKVSSAGESHPDALSEPYVNVSAHTAPASEPRRTPNCQ